MQSKHALILAFLITGLIASNYFLFQFLSAQQKLETAIVARVIDADTIELEDGRTLRLLNINDVKINRYAYTHSTIFDVSYTSTNSNSSCHFVCQGLPF